MVMSRYPNLLTKRLRQIIVRDSIIAAHFAISIAAILDVMWDARLTSTAKLWTLTVAGAFMVVGMLRLRQNSILNRKPIIAIVLYSILIFYAITYLTDIRSFWVFIWIVPLFLANFFYGRKGAYIIIGLAGLSLFFSVYTYIDFITDKEDYLYIVAEFVFFVAASFFFMDTLSVSEEDRVLLLDSLHKAEYEEGRMNSLVKSVHEAVVGVDTQGVVTFHNPAANILFKKEGSLIGKPLDGLAGFVDEGNSKLSTATILERGAERYESRDLKLAYDDDNEINLYTSVAPVTSADSSVTEGFVFIMKDITKERSLEDQRRAFVSLMSHELRTPLTVAEANLSNLTRMLNLQNGSDEVKHAADQAHQQALELSRIINDFSFFLDATTENSITREPVDMYTLVEEVRQIFEPIAAEKGLYLKSLAGDHDDRLLAFPTQGTHIREILRHMIANGIKYTEQGGISVRIFVEHDIAKVAVTDTGVGIAQENQADIFKPFVQSDDYERRKFGGAGLGLFIVKQLSELLGGSIVLASEEGKGSTFTLEIPFPKEESQLNKAMTEAAESAPAATPAPQAVPA